MVLDKSKCNVAVIGLGNMGQHHSKAYAQLENVNFVAACDPNLSSFEKVVKEEETEYFSNVDDMVASGVKVDAVSVCVPTLAHYHVAKQCIDNGMAVLVEKPIAETVDQAYKLIKYAEDKKAILTVGHIERFNPAVKKAKEIVQLNKLGHIRSIISKRYGPFPKQIKDANVLVDVAVHDIDIVHYLLDRDLSNLTIHRQKIHSDDRDDFAQLILKYDPDLMINIFVTWAVPYKKRDIEIIGDKGVLNIDCLNQSVNYYNVNIEKDDQNISLPISEKQLLTIEKKEPIIEQCRSFIHAVNTKSAPLISPKQATQALAIALDHSFLPV